VGLVGLITLRPYQLEAHKAAREAWPETPGVMWVICTGGGKTLTALALCVRGFLAHGKRVVWLAHRQELLNQPAEEMAKHWPEYSAGIVQANRNAPDASIVFASVATLAQSPHRAEEIRSHGGIALIVCDEAHHAVSKSHQAAIDAIGAPLRLGLTATPHRADGGDLSEDWEICFSYDTVTAIREGFLVPPYAVISKVPDLNLSAISGRRDYDDAELGAELLRAGVVDHTVATLASVHTLTRLPERDLSHIGSARGLSCLVFTATVEQARLTADALCADGWRARVIHGGTPDRDRRRLLRAFKDGTVDVLCNAAVLTEGTDLPNAGCVVLARPTRSWSLFVQMLGRGLRLSEGKARCLILDLAGATDDHDLRFAPVLIGGRACPESPGGSHDMREVEGGGGRCELCSKYVACWENLGSHTWGPDHRCTACDAIQCEESPNLGHGWVAQADHKRRCMYCGAETSDPLAGMIRDRKRAEDPIEADWVRIPRVSPECWAVDCHEHGLLFVLVEPGRESMRVYWLIYRGRKPRALTSGPVPRDLVRIYADDIVSRAAKANAAVERGAPSWVEKQRAFERYGLSWRGEAPRDWWRRVARAKARDRGISTGLLAPA